MGTQQGQDAPPARSGAEAEGAEPVDFRESFLWTRFIVGVIGVSLAPVLIAGDRVLFGADSLLPALSDYYHSPMRDWFVGSLFAIGAGLLVYMADRKNWLDFWLSSAAGCCAVVVALFPTNPVDGPVTWVSVVHAVFAVLMMLLLTAICLRFGEREGSRDDRSRRQQRRWRRFHRACGLVIVGALVFTAACVGLGLLQRYAALLGESVAVAAFGLSWLVKGTELWQLVRDERRWGWVLPRRTRPAVPPTR